MNIKRWWRSSPTFTKDEKMPLNALNAQCAELEHTLKFTQDRFHCLMNIMASHQTPAQYEFHTTTKGIPVLLCIVNEGRELELYNLNNNREANCMLRLSGVYFGTEAKVVNISGGIRLGHGSLAVERFLKLCKDKGVEKVRTEFMVMEKDLEEKLTRFFAKCGFEVSSQVGCNWVMVANLNSIH